MRQEEKKVTDCRCE